MFIDLTRHGGGRVLRVAIAAIAYLDTCEGGTAVHLVGGETLRIAETSAEIEARSVPEVTSVELVASPSPTIDEFVAAYRLLVSEAAQPCAIDELETTIAAPRPAGKGRR